MTLSVSGATMVDVGGDTVLSVSDNKGDVQWKPKGDTATMASLTLLQADGTQVQIHGLSGGRARWDVSDDSNSVEAVVHVGVVLIYGEDGRLYSLSPRAWQESEIKKVPSALPSFESMNQSGQIGVYVALDDQNPGSTQWTTCYVVDLKNIPVPNDGDG